MKAKDLLQITTVAMGTATLTLTTFLAAPLDAGSETDAIGATLANPKLVANGVEFTLTPVEGCGLKAGDQPEFELHAVNTRTTPSEVTLRFAMTGSTPASLMSRMMTLPTLLWQHESTLTLHAHETRTMTLATATDLPENNAVSVTLTEVDPKEKPMAPEPAVVVLDPQLFPAMGNGVVVLNFSTVNEDQAPTFAVAP